MEKQPQGLYYGTSIPSVKRYAKTQWCAADVLGEASRKGIKLTPDQASKLLADNENHIIDAMVRAGWEVIEEAISELNQNKERKL